MSEEGEEKQKTEDSAFQDLETRIFDPEFEDFVKNFFRDSETNTNSSEKEGELWNPITKTLSKIKSTFKNFANHPKNELTDKLASQICNFFRQHFAEILKRNQKLEEIDEKLKDFFIEG